MNPLKHDPVHSTPTQYCFAHGDARMCGCQLAAREAFRQAIAIVDRVRRDRLADAGYHRALNAVRRELLAAIPKA